jgi:RNA polymerase sigma factor (sigma-70 family)
MDDLRIELRCKNAALWHAVFDTHESVAAFCRAANVQQTQVGAWLNLKQSPYGANGLYASARRICEFTGIGADELFPPDLYADMPNANMVAVEVPHARMLALSSRLMAPLAIDGVEAGELREAISTALGSLTPREERLLRAIHGFDGGDERPRNDIAREMGISPEWARQIEAKAMRKLRGPKRSRALRPHLVDSRDVSLV